MNRPMALDTDLSLAALWRWWRDEMASLMPRAVHRWLRPTARTLILRETADGRYEVSCGRTHLSGLGWEEASAAVARERRRLGPLLRIVVVLDRARCLMLDHRLPAHALPQLRAVLGLELELQTPFTRDDVVFDYQLIGPAGPADRTRVVRHAVVPKQIVATMLADLDRVGGVDRLAVGDANSGDGGTTDADREGSACEGGGAYQFDLLNGLDAGGVLRRRTPFVRRLNQALALAVFLAGSALAVRTVLETSMMNERLEQQSALEKRLTGDVSARRRQRDARDTLAAQIAALGERKAEAAETVDVWESVTQVLPGSAWLSELRIDDGVLTLDGYSRSAAELVGVFARAPAFSKVAFTSPVTRDPQQGVERFQLRMTIERRRLSPNEGERRGGTP